jgi:exodeoxyribonuclease V alpha subunit
MQLRNDYEREVFNGDIGRFTAADRKTGRVTIDFDGRLAVSGLGALVPAYAVSVYKARGAEFPAVIVPLLMQHFPLLQRNLLYTAGTRGKRPVLLAGSRKALAIALRNDTPHPEKMQTRRHEEICGNASQHHT